MSLEKSWEDGDDQQKKLKAENARITAEYT